MSDQIQREGQPEQPFNPEQLAISAATTPEQAVARFWANVMLDVDFDNTGDYLHKSTIQGLIEEERATRRPDIEQHIGAFVGALEESIAAARRYNAALARNPNAPYELYKQYADEISTQYEPLPVLVESALRAGMDPTQLDFVFPFKTHTRIDRDGTVYATVREGEYKRIWPPQDPTSSSDTDDSGTHAELPVREGTGDPSREWHVMKLSDLIGGETLALFARRFGDDFAGELDRIRMTRFVG